MQCVKAHQLNQNHINEMFYKDELISVGYQYWSHRYLELSAGTQLYH